MLFYTQNIFQEIILEMQSLIYFTKMIVDRNIPDIKCHLLIRDNLPTFVWVMNYPTLIVKAVLFIHSNWP